MEAAREEVLLELKGSHNDRDTELCKSYFKGLDEVTDTFKQELGRYRHYLQLIKRKITSTFNSRLHHYKVF